MITFLIHEYYKNKVKKIYEEIDRLPDKEECKIDLIKPEERKHKSLMITIDHSWNRYKIEWYETEETSSDMCRCISGNLRKELICARQPEDAVEFFLKKYNDINSTYLTVYEICDDGRETEISRVDIRNSYKDVK